jgi:hypothetical protein
MAILAAVGVSRDAEGAVATAVADGVLAVVLVTAYVLARGYTARRDSSAAAWSQP